MSGSGTQTPALVTKVEAGRLLGVSRQTITRLVNRGALREVRLDAGMTPRLRREDVLALAEVIPLNDERRPTGGARYENNDASHDTERQGRCQPCGGWISPRCDFCHGQPDPAVTVELLARCRTSVDRATARWAA